MSGKEQTAHVSRIHNVEVMVAWLLRVGVAVSAICIALGVLWVLLSGHTGYGTGEFPNTLTAVWSGIIGGKPFALIMLGLLLLIATPVLRVAASVAAFWLEPDRLYAVITLFVLLVLIVSFILGKAE